MDDEVDYVVMGAFEVTLPKCTRDVELEAIEARLRDFDATDLFQVAADISEAGRARRIAMQRLLMPEMQRLSDELVLRPDDGTKWMAFSRCAPTKTDAAILALRRCLDSASRRDQRLGLYELSRMGDRAAISQMEAMLTNEDPDEHRFAISCIAQRDDEVALGLLRAYASCESNPLDIRVQAAGSVLSKGFDDVLPFLECTAKSEVESAYYAAINIQQHNRLAGLRLLDAILAIPAHPAAPIIVLDIFSKIEFRGIKESNEDQLAEARRLLAIEIDEEQSNA